MAQTPVGRRADVDRAFSECEGPIAAALKLIYDPPAATSAGITAKARALHFQLQKYVLWEGTQAEDELAWSLVNDIISGAGPLHRARLATPPASA